MPIKKKKPIKKKEAVQEEAHHPTVWDDGGAILMVPVEDLLPDEDNPNEMDERTMDTLVEEIREQGFDEPLLVRPAPGQEGKYEIGSGHHRHKAAMICGLTELPVIVKHWSDREKKAALTKRNVLRGNLNKTKLRKLYEDLSKDRDPVQVQRELGFTDQKKFEAMIEQVAKDLPPKQRKKLAQAKEQIKSMDDLSSVLNRIFKESGSELDEGYLVFSFGGKNHHYFQIDADTDQLLQHVMQECEERGDLSYNDAMKQILQMGFDPSRLTPTPGLQSKPKGGKKKATRKRKAKP